MRCPNCGSYATPTGICANLRCHLSHSPRNDPDTKVHVFRERLSPNKVRWLLKRGVWLTWQFLRGVASRIRALNDRLMLRQGWVRVEELNKLDARADRLIELFDGQPVTTGRDAARLASLLADQQYRQDEYERKQRAKK